MAWSASEKIASYGLRLVLGLILARLLSPSDYGLVALLTIFFAIAGSLVDSGFGVALIRRKRCSDIDCSTVFFFNMATSAALFTLFFAVAPLVADFYGEPRLVGVMRVASLVHVLNGLAVVQSARLNRELNFRSLALASFSSVAVSGVLGICCAFRGCGYWALVVQMISGAGINAAMLWFFSRWIPRLRISAKSFKELFSFGSRVVAAGLVHNVYANLHAVLIGKFFSIQDLGLYNRGAQFAQLPSETVGSVVVQVNYPVLAKIQDDDGALREKYGALIRDSMFVAVPLIAGMASVSEALIETVIGQRWLPCCIYLQIVALAVVWDPMSRINLNVLYVKGRSDLVLKLEIVKKSLAVVMLISLLPLGIVPFCWGCVAYSAAALCFNSYYTGLYLDLGFLRQLRLICPILINGLLMAAIVRLTMRLGVSPAVRLGIGIVTGAIVYVAAAVVTRDESLGRIVKAVGRLVLRR